MKNLVKFIIETEATAEGWNGKFYTNKEGKTSIYIDNKEFDVTEMYNACRKADGYVYASEIKNFYMETIDTLIDAALDLDMEDITAEEFAAKKQEVINSLN